MKRAFSSVSLTLPTLVLLGLCSLRPAQAQYQVIDLGPGVAYSVNAGGQVVGYLNVDVGGASYQHAFFYDGATVHDLSGQYGGAVSSSILRGLNSFGQATGYRGSNNNYTDSRGILYTATTNTGSDIGSLAGASGFSQGYGINNSGQISGISDPQNSATGHREGFIRNANGTFVDIGSLGGNAQRAYINDSGNVAGRSLDGSNQQRGFYYDGSLRNIDAATFTQGNAISSNNTVVGTYVGGLGEPFYQAFTYNSATSAITGLDFFNGTPEVPNSISTQTDAFGINSSSIVVGDDFSADRNGTVGPDYDEAVYWDSTGIHNLNALISSNPANIHLDQALGISANGYIVGVGEVGRTQGQYGFFTPFSGVNHAFLLVPFAAVPEPGSVALLASLLLGSAGLTTRRRLRRSK